MSVVINCSACGAANQLPEGKTSMFCAFCGNAIEKTQVIQNEYFNPLKSKPEITNPAVHSREGVYASTSKEYFRERVSGGWQVHDGLLGTRFIPDEQYEVGGYELCLSKRGISKLDQVITWFTDSELESIKYLDLSDNKITDISGIEKFKGTEIINLSNNNIRNLSFMGSFNKLQVLDLSDNKIKKLEGLFNNEEAIEDLSYYKEYRGNRISKDIHIFLNNNEISEINDDIIIHLKDLLLINGAIKFDLHNNPIISNPQLKKFKKLDCTLTTEELCRSENFWFKNVTKYLKNSYKNDKWSNPDIDRKAFVEWMNKFGEEHQKEPKIHSYILIYLTRDKSESEWYNLTYPSFDEVKLALKQKTGYNPDDVKTGACFIATATMGSYDHPKVVELRYFRDHWILSKSWGNNFVRCYYHYGEKAAKFIDKSRTLKKICYFLIVNPIVYLSRLVDK